MNKAFPYFTAIFAGCLKLMIQQKKDLKGKKGRKKSFCCSFLSNSLHFSHVAWQSQQSQVCCGCKMISTWATLRTFSPWYLVRNTGICFEVEHWLHFSFAAPLCLKAYQGSYVFWDKKVRRSQGRWLSMCVPTQARGNRAISSLNA